MPITDVLLEQPQEESSELWARFSNAGDEDEFFESWLALQCGLIARTLQAVLVTRKAEGPFTPVALWPRRGGDPARLAEVLEQVIEAQCGLLLELEGDEGCFGIAYPLVIEQRLVAVVAMEIITDGEQDLQAAMQQLQWGVAWLELRYRRQKAGEDAAALTRLRAAVDLLAVALSEEHFTGAAMAFVTELAAATDCDRVSLGFLRGQHVRVEAVSNSADFDHKMNLARAIALAMDEAILQRQELSYPPTEESEALIVHNHEILSRQQNQARVVTFPLFGQGSYYGALTCERPAGRSFTAQEIEFIRAVAGMVGPALEAKEQNDRPLPLKIKDSAATQLRRLFGPRYLGRKLFALAVLLIILFSCFAKGDYNLAADTALEGAIRRAVVAPFNGYIDQAPARAGDLVAQGDLLCALDDRDLRLERLTGLSQKSQLEKQFHEAVARHDRAQANIVQARLEQASSELALIESKLERTRLVAPFSGLLVSGDLSQRLGGAVEQGELLFELSPLDAYRVILKVDDRRIADVHVGQLGKLVLSSQPNEHYGFTISKITPLTTAEGGRNFFRVEARLDMINESLRPGMEGVGKIFIDERRLIDIWTRDLVEWLQLWFWSWFP